MKKKIILLLTTFSLYSISQAKGWDVAPKPDLNSSSATTDRVDQLRKLSIKSFEEIINNECSQVAEFAKFSIKNWSEAKIGEKSEDEAKKYSEKLVQQTLDAQPKSHPFHFSYSLYTQVDSEIQDIYFTQKKRPSLSQDDIIDSQVDIIDSQADIINKMQMDCITKLAPQKYFEILNNSQSSHESKKNIDLNELEEKKIKSNLKKALISLNQSVPEGSKLTPIYIGKKLSFSGNDLNVSYMLMAEDIKYTMTKLNQPWYVYQYVLNKKYADYIYFLKYGGNNRQFATLALRTKILNQKSNNFLNITTLNLEEINSLKNKPFTGKPNQIIIWTKLLGYQESDQLN